MNRFSLNCLDAFIVAVSCLVAMAIRKWSVVEAFSQAELYGYAIISFAISAVVLSAGRNERRIWDYFSLSDAFRLAVCIAVSVSITSMIIFVFDRASDIPRSLPPIQFLIALVATGGIRFVFRSINSRSVGHETASRSITPRAPNQILVIGSGDLADLYLRCVERLAGDHLNVAGLLVEDKRLNGRSLRNKHILGQPGQINETIANLAVHGIFIDKVVVTVPFNTLSRASREALRNYEKQTGKALDIFQVQLGLDIETARQQSSDSVAQSPHYYRVPGIYPAMKRCLDVVGASVLLIILLPLIALTWLASLLDVGAPVFFWQVRPGRYGRAFRVLKFRTMRGAHDARGQRISDEKRTSALGHALRRYRLDELPQLLSILKGDMSFIGPRPLLPIDQPKETHIRLSVRPGLTGWAQVHGGRIINAEDKAALDAWYVKNMSFKNDLLIAWKTVQVLLRGEVVPEQSVLHQAHHVSESLRDEALRSGNLVR